ncbi:MAG: ATPase [Tannerellaceae bacterium]|jgi:N-acetylglucosamine kinase-like BadF-type ATPase|nr:ATPase [Tannerellaceae bacterium]
MILLADGGSTKTDWCLVEGGNQVARTLTRGSSPIFHPIEALQAEWKETVIPFSAGCRIEAIHFYGAGCFSEEMKNSMRTALSNCWPEVVAIKVESDLLGAARGLCGNEAGIACILGTGSNSCTYDGQNICSHIPPLGYILGDEGSGAMLGKLLIGACLRDQLTPELKERFFEYCGLTPEALLYKVYHDPSPNRFLSSFSPFLLDNLTFDNISTLIHHAFSEFLLKNVYRYDYTHLPIHFTGSIAFHYREVLREAASGLHISIASINLSPMEGLIRYHSSLR